jgi:hypothetical protein
MPQKALRALQDMIGRLGRTDDDSDGRLLERFVEEAIAFSPSLSDSGT